MNDMLNKIINERLTVRRADEEIDKLLNGGSITTQEEPQTVENEQENIIPEHKEEKFRFINTPIVEESEEQPEQIIEDDESEEEIKPGKFFNILDEQEKQPSKSEEPMFDFNKMFINPVEQQPFNSNNALLDELNEIENSINNSKIIKPLEQPEEELEEEPKIEMPKQDETDDDLEFIEEFEDEDTIEQAPKTEEITEQEPILEKQIIIPETTITSFKDVLQLIRECSEKIEDAGYKIDTEEIDLDDIYQVIFKINK